jgi:hypothetical protein
MEVRTLLEAVIGIVIGVTLFPVVQTAVENVNSSDSTITALLGLIPMVYIIVVLAGSAAYVYFKR